MRRADPADAECVTHGVECEIDLPVPGSARHHTLLELVTGWTRRIQGRPREVALHLRSQHHLGCQPHAGRHRGDRTTNDTQARSRGLVDANPLARFRDRAGLHWLALGRQLVLGQGSHGRERAHPLILVLSGDGGAELVDGHEGTLVGRRIRRRTHERRVTHQTPRGHVDTTRD